MTAASPWTHTWNYRNNLTQSGNGTATSTFAYDHAGDRVLKTEGGITTYYPNKLYNVSSATTTKHIFANGIPIATITSGTAASGIALDATSTSITTGWNPTTTKTWTHTVTGSNPVIVLSADIWQDVPGTGAITSATWNGGAFTKATSTRAGSMASEIWYLVASTTGAKTMSVTVTGETDAIKLAASSFTGVSQSSPLDTTNIASGYGGNPTISATTGTANDLVTATLSRFGTTDATTNRTSLYKDRVTSTLGAASYQIATTPTSYSDTYTGTASADWSMAMAALKPATGGTGSTTMYWIHTDHLGGSNVVTGANGNVTQTLDYYPFGSRRINSGTDVSQREFIGEIFDESSNLSYLNARYYNGTRGQFLSEDPVHLALGDTTQVKGYTGLSQQAYLTDPHLLNSYGYARDNPVTNSDPKGLTAAGIPLSPIEFLFIGLFSPVEVSYDPVYESAQYAAQNSVTNKVIGAAMAMQGGGKFTAEGKLINAVEGARREALVKQERAALNPTAEILSQRTLLNPEGKKAIDPQTGMGRRIDIAVVYNGKVTGRLEVTSLTADKSKQFAREQRIIDSGGTYIRGSDGKLINFANTGGVTTPATITRRPRKRKRGKMAKKSLPPLDPEFVMENNVTMLQHYRTNVHPPLTTKELEQIKRGWFAGYKFLQENGLTTRKLVDTVDDVETLVLKAKDLTSEGMRFCRLDDSPFGRYRAARGRDFTKDPEKSVKRILERDLKKLREGKL